MEPITEVTDATGNKCTVEYFGSIEEAQKALDSLRECKECVNCSRCSNCSRCYDCSDCYGCSNCYGCSRCSGCSCCSRCYDCSRCSDCSDCSDMEAKKVAKLPVPIIESIHEKVLAAVESPSALDMTSWHTCDTTHCRAGWVVALAGPEGKALEERFGTGLAAQMIYDASGHKINPCRFHDSNEAAMADIRKCAGVS